MVREADLLHSVINGDHLHPSYNKPGLGIGLQ